MMFLFIGRRCAKTVINIINSLPYKCANGPFINKALTTVYYTKLAAVSLRCLEKKQQQIKSKNIKILHEKPTQIDKLWYQMTFNPSEETIVITACSLQHKCSYSHHNKREWVKTLLNNDIKTNITTKNSILPSHNPTENGQIVWYPSSLDVEGVICLKVVLFLFVIWVSVVTFHIFEEHAAKHAIDAESGNKFEDDYLAP